MNSKRLPALKPTLEESRIAILLSIMMIALFLAYTIYMFFFWELPISMQLEHPRVPAYFSYPEDAMPFPATLDPSNFQAGPIREAYTIAKEWPRLLVQEPCYCPAYQFHSLLDCFGGTEATICANCISEALLVARLNREGKTASEIRAEIIHQHSILASPSE